MVTERKKLWTQAKVQALPYNRCTNGPSRWRKEVFPESPTKSSMSQNTFQDSEGIKEIQTTLTVWFLMICWVIFWGKYTFFSKKDAPTQVMVKPCFWGSSKQGIHMGSARIWFIPLPTTQGPSHFRAGWGQNASVILRDFPWVSSLKNVASQFFFAPAEANSERLTPRFGPLQPNWMHATAWDFPSTKMFMIVHRDFSTKKNQWGKIISVLISSYPNL